MSTSKEKKTKKPISQKKDLKQELENYKKQAEENLIGWQRAKADFLNYKKDQEKYVSEFRKYASEDVLISILPTIDNFELAIKHMPKELEESDWTAGIICIKSQLENILKEIGLEEIKAVGEKFDPSLFESIGEKESDQKEGTIITEVQKGYRMSGKVVRVGKVVVAGKKVDTQ
ncbi:MAG: nucleotide exchange factor GrpE [Candidatus Pacebacteria bacterium]|nr:nucleotide exchange factor GrpE [Candidatus Paceibacterota bacterium]